MQSSQSIEEEEMNKENDAIAINFTKNLTLKGNSIIENHIENLKAPLPNPCNIFEELPVGIKSKNPMMDEYPPEFDPQTLPSIDSDPIPLSDRIRSKLWKTRQNALDELITMIKSLDNPADPLFSEYLPELSKLLTDSNLIILEKSIFCIQNICNKIEPHIFLSITSFEWKEMLKSLIEKGYGTNKMVIKGQVEEILIFFARRVEKEGVIDACVGLLGHKNPKVVVSTIQLILILIRNFGVRKLDYLKPFFTEMEKLSNSSTTSIKNEVLEFYKEAYKWMGEGMTIFLQKANKSIKAPFDKFMEDCPKENMKPLIEDSPVKGGVNQKVKNEKDVDMYELLEGVDVFGKYNDGWCEKVLAQVKWSEKKAMLDDFLIACAVPKLTPSNFYPIIGLLKRILSDPNINVVQSGIKILGQLSKGLRKNFTSASKIFFPILLGKFKEKKSQIVDETHKTLDMFYFSLPNFEEIFEDAKIGLNDKVIHAKLNTLMFLERHIEKLFNNSKTINFMKIGCVIKGLLEDGASEIRESALKLIVKLKIKAGEAMNELLSDISNSRMQRILEEEKKLLGEKRETTSISPISSTPVKSKLNNANIKNISDKSPNNCKAIANNNNNNSNHKNNNKPIKHIEEKKFNSSIQLNLEEANTILMEKESLSNLLMNFESKEWKVKIEILNEITPIIMELSRSQCPQSNLVDAFFVFLKNKFKDFKESNLNLIKALLTCFQTFSEAQMLTKNQILFLSPFFIERFLDGARSVDVIWNFYVSLFSYHDLEGIYDPLFQYFNTIDFKKMNPKQTIEFITFLIKSIEYVSLLNMPLKQIIDFSKIYYLNSGSNPALRQKALALFKKIYQYIGPNIFSLIKDLPSNVLKNLQTEFTSIQMLSDAEKKSKIMSNKNNENDNDVNSHSFLLEKLPKSDISLEISRLLKKFMDPDWKIQKEGIDEVERLLANNPKIHINNLGEFVNCLKNGLKDKKNKNLLRNYVNLLGKFAEASGKDFLINGKQILPHLLSSLSDKQSLVRCDVANCIQKIEVAVGPDFILNGLVNFICNAENKEFHSYEAKLEIFSWLTRNNNTLIKYNAIKNLMNAIIMGLIDKNKEIRILAEQIITNIVNSLGPEVILEAIKDLRPAIISQIKGFLERLRVEIDNGGKEIMHGRAISNEKSPMKSSKPMNTKMQIEPSLEDLKQTRFVYEIANPWPINELNEELIEQLKNDMNLLFPSEIAKKLFSFDFKRNMEGIIEIKNNRSFNIISFSDLLIKWIFIKVWGNFNPDLLQQLLDLLEFIVMKFITSEYYKLHSTEIKLISNILINPIMLQSEIFSQKVLSLSKILTSNYPISNNILHSLLDQNKDERIKPFLPDPEFQNDCATDKNLNNNNNNNSHPTEMTNFFANKFINNSVGVFSNNPSNELSGYIKNANNSDIVALKATSDLTFPKNIITSKENNQNQQFLNEVSSENFKSTAFFGRGETLNLTSNRKSCQNILDYSLRASPQTEMTLSRDHIILLKNIESLSNSNLNEKLDALNYIRDFLRENNPENQRIIEHEASNILGKFTEIFRDNDMCAQFITFSGRICMDIMQNKFFVENVNYIALYDFLEGVLNRLLAEDANKNNENSVSTFSIDGKETESTVRNLNSLVLKILENYNVNKIYQILFDLLIKYRKLGSFSKFDALCIKCILKLTKVLEVFLNELNIEQLLFKFHEYMSESFNENTKWNEDLGIKTIKTILKEMVRFKGRDILNLYKQASFYSEKHDGYLIKWIDLMFSNSVRKKQSESNLDEQLKNCISKIRNPSKFEEGISELSEILSNTKDLDLAIIKKYVDPSEFDEIKSSLENKRKNVPTTIKQDVKWVAFNEKNPEQAAFDIKKI